MLARDLRSLVGTGERKEYARTLPLCNRYTRKHPIVTFPLRPDFGGVTDGTRAKNPSSLIRYPRARIP
ncbi:hypothetical protein Tco_0515452 [Tanacetum coccineum]